MNLAMFASKVIPKKKLADILLVINVFVWYYCTVNVLYNVLSEMNLDYMNELLIWCGNYCGAAISALIGALLPDKYIKREKLLSIWILLGIFSSLTWMLMSLLTVSFNMLLLTASFFGVSFGIGTPICMERFSESVAIENRAKVAGVMVFLNGAFSLILFSLIININNLLAHTLILAIWRSLSLPFLLLGERFEISQRSQRVSSYILVLKNRSFLLYLTPWTMFSLVNALSTPAATASLEDTLTYLLPRIEYFLAGVFAILCGYLTDIFGRKRMTVLAFVILGLGYAVLGIFPERFFCWLLYTIVDGVAWGIFSVVFIFTVWGDLSREEPSGKYYAIGGLPYLFSFLLHNVLAVRNIITVPEYSIFSFAAFFLFLAVVPLMFAPETLPEKMLKERDLRSYIEKAKRVREKFTKG